MKEDKEAIVKKHMAILGISYEEAEALYDSDKAIDRGEKQPFDLTPEQAKEAKKACHTGTRKTPTTYKFTKRERKPNATKGGIISKLAQFLSASSGFEVENLEITNKERQVAFEIGGEKFELTLVQKRKPKS